MSALVSTVSRPPGRTVRRAFVGALYGGYIAGLVLVATVLSDPRGTGEVTLLILCGIVSLIGLGGILKVGGAFRANPTEYLDERQRAVWNHAYQRAYLLLATLVICFSIYAVLAWLLDLSLPHGRLPLVALAAGLVLAACTLPGSIVAWNEPDPPEDSGAFSQAIPAPGFESKNP